MTTKAVKRAWSAAEKKPAQPQARDRAKYLRSYCAHTSTVKYAQCMTASLCALDASRAKQALRNIKINSTADGGLSKY